MNDVILTQQHGNIFEIALNRPEAYNALNLDMMKGLSEALFHATNEQSVQGVVITGRGKAFCSGGDLKWISEQTEETEFVLYNLVPEFHRSILLIREMDKPVVAAINGIAAGGGLSLSLACDFRIINESAVMRQAYTSSGLSIDGGGSFALPRMVGLARAMEIMAFDNPISPAQALEWGLVTQVVPDGQAFDASLEMLRGLTQRSLHSFAWSKRLMVNSWDHDLPTVLELERQGISECAGHPDGQEGIKAFVEKRKPSFPGTPK